MWPYHCSISSPRPLRCIVCVSVVFFCMENDFCCYWRARAFLFYSTRFLFAAFLVPIKSEQQRENEMKQTTHTVYTTKKKEIQTNSYTHPHKMYKHVLSMWYHNRFDWAYGKMNSLYWSKRWSLFCSINVSYTTHKIHCAHYVYSLLRIYYTHICVSLCVCGINADPLFFLLKSPGLFLFCSFFSWST